MNKIQSSNNIAIAIGDPSGIGIEVTLKSLFHLKNNKKIDIILVGCKKTINKIYMDLKKKGINKLEDPSQYKILDIPCEGEFVPGKTSLEAGKASFNWLTHASNLVLNKKAKALVTAPITKFSWHQAGHFYPGQTERLAEITNSKEVSMLFTAISPKSTWRFNTLLATTHIPLSKINKELSKELIIKKMDMLLTFCKKFNNKPKIAIAGLNPHSGENGQLGKEEIEWLIPTLKQWKKNNPLVEIFGPIPPDTCWISASKAWDGDKSVPNKYDGYLALYHDQGLIPVKLIAFDLAVNTTLGLPFVRTSPDHGTGLDIAGQGIARPESMIEAIKAAWELS